MRTPSGWIRARLFARQYNEVPKPGSPEESLLSMLELSEAKCRVLEIRASVLASLKDGKGTQEALNQFLQAYLPMPQKDAEKADMQRLMMKEMSRGALRIRPLSSPGDVRKLHSKQAVESIRQERKKHQTIPLE